MRGETLDGVGERGDWNCDRKWGNLRGGDDCKDGVGLLQLRCERDCGGRFRAAFEHGQQRFLRTLSRCGGDGAERDTSAGTSIAGEFRKFYGADVPGYAGIERK